jgi:hypothetical protein
MCDERKLGKNEECTHSHKWDDLKYMWESFQTEDRCFLEYIFIWICMANCLPLIATRTFGSGRCKTNAPRPDTEL